MSTFPQPDSRDFETPHSDPFTNEDLRTVADGIEHSVTVIEPRIRHFNRRLTELFGPHPSSPDGTWVFVATDPDGSVRCGFHPIELPSIYRLESVFDEIRDLVGARDAEVGFGRRSPNDVGALVVGDAADLRDVPPIHVRVERRS